MAYRKVSDDVRGVILVIAKDRRREVKVVTIKAGYARGGHMHSYPESFFVVSGTLKYFNGSEMSHTERDVTPGDSVETDTGVPHMFIAETDSVLLEITPAGAYDAEPYPPWRKLVEDLMGRQGSQPDAGPGQA
ncbi:MAG: cupin domain-containing protein [Nitrososphaerota archaeon]|jgi:mannose-6-phosphate isomerase-like protein (cupin superfamily)|nr:cupin domain-containing protein [Nitrososphaerota archaeon]MDG6948970.1 cupin domain-containing protein [Nitrososphaerota archaeon]